MTGFEGWSLLHRLALGWPGNAVAKIMEVFPEQPESA